MNREELENLLKADFNLTDFMLEQLYKYYEYLQEKSKVMNLTAITELDDVYIKHFYDSLLLIKYIDIDNKSLLDIGSGAGFPGIVLKIASPNTKITLLEPTKKRCGFLQEVIDLLELKDINIVCDRAENVAKQYAESYDIVTARAVASLNILLELGARFVKIGGTFAPMKGASAADEINISKKASNILGLKLDQIDNINLPIIADKRAIITYIKEQKTSDLYPRMYAKIKNNPL